MLEFPPGLLATSAAAPAVLRTSVAVPLRNVSRLKVGLSSNPDSAIQATELRPAVDIVREFYSLINTRQPEAALELVTDDCLYEDFSFAEPFKGKQATLGLFKRFTDGGVGLNFVIDDISTGDPDAVGLTWHVEWKGTPFPFSRGCSFYRCEVVQGQRKIKYFRDIVESPVKAGDATVVAIKAVIFLLERFPQLAKMW